MGIINTTNPVNITTTSSNHNHHNSFNTVGGLELVQLQLQLRLQLQLLQQQVVFDQHHLIDYLKVRIFPNMNVYHQLQVHILVVMK